VAAYNARGQTERVASVVNSGTIMVVCMAALTALPLVAFRTPLVRIFNVEAGFVPAASTALLIAAGTYVLARTFDVLRALLEGVQRVDIGAITQMIALCVYFVAVLMLLRAGMGLIGLAWAGAVLVLVAAIIRRLWLHRLLPRWRWRPHQAAIAPLKALVHFGWKIQVLRLAVVVATHTGKLVVAKICGASLAGLYAIGQQAATAIFALVYPVSAGVLPAASHLDALEDNRRLAELYNRAARYVMLTGAPLVAVMVTLTPQVIVAWMGADALSAVTVTRFLMPGIVASLVTMMAVCVGQGIGKPQFEMYRALIYAPLELMVSIPLTLWLGLPGAAVAWSACNVATALFALWLFHRYTSWSLWRFVTRTIAPPLVIATIAGGVAYLALGSLGLMQVPPDRWAALPPLAIGTVLIGLVYSVTALLSGIITVAEIKSIVALLRRQPDPRDAVGMPGRTRVH